jgi:hypothetical protein
MAMKRQPSGSTNYIIEGNQHAKEEDKQFNHV